MARSFASRILAAQGRIPQLNLIKNDEPLNNAEVDGLIKNEEEEASTVVVDDTTGLVKPVRRKHMKVIKSDDLSPDPNPPAA